jgi:hypothetical protein
VRAARAALLAVAGLLALATPGAGGAEPVEGERIGRYRVTRTGDGVELASPRDRSLGLALAAGGAVALALGAGLSAAGRRGPGIALLLVGLGLAAIGTLAAFGTTRVRANRVELVREGFAGRIERWPRDAIAGVDVARRDPSAEDFKRAGTRPWDVRLRTPDGRLLPVRFAASSEAEARALARVLGEALGLR